MSALQVLQISCFSKQIFSLVSVHVAMQHLYVTLVVNPLCIICELYREQSIL